MRKAFILVVILLLQMAWLAPQTDLAVSAAKQEKNKSSKLASEAQADISLTNENYLLEGLVDQVHFYYEVPVDKLKGDNYVYLHVDYSDLLLDGSTLTVSVDDERVKSYRLKDSEKDATFKVPLKGKALERGFHHITVAFYGELSKEMCTNEENPANWLTILSDSYVHLEMEDTFADRDNMLADYPFPFVQTNKTKQMQGKIVVPNNASSDILSTALQVANYLHEQTGGREAIDIVLEKDVEKVEDHLIAIGAVGDWEGSLKKHITGKTSSADGLAIYNDVFSTDKGKKQIMVMTGEKDASILGLSAILTVDDYVKQLTNNELQITNLPNLEKEKVRDKVSFKQMNIPNVDLSGVTSQSEFYFYDLPSYVDQTKLAYLHLKMKISKTLLYESEYSHALSELTIHLNGVPHSVSIRDLEEDSDGFYRLALPVSETTLQEERVMSIQFAGHGLKEREICVPPSEEKWIFIDDSSYLEYKLLASEGKTADFYDWPKPFVASEEVANTLVVLTEEVTAKRLKQVQEITNTIKVKDQVAPIKVTTATEVTDEELKENNVIVLGSLAKWDAWKAKQEDALIEMDKSGSLQVDAFGFLTETAKHVAFIQPSVWNDDHSLAVFTSVDDGEKSFISKKLIENLQEEKTHTNIMVETLAGDVFTNEIAEEALDNEPSVDKKEATAPWMLYVFIGIFIFAVIVFIIVLRRVRKRKVSE